MYALLKIVEVKQFTYQFREIKLLCGLHLLFNADKLLDFLTKLSAVSKNTTLQALNKLASQYDGLMMGFELKK